MKQVEFKKLSETAVTPFQATDGSAGYDLTANTSECIGPHSTKVIGTGIAVSIPSGYFGAVFMRSGTSTGMNLSLANGVGVIDNDYRGEIKLPIYNASDKYVSVVSGMRVAQLVFIPYKSFELVEKDTLEATERGEGGFGSTDIVSE